MPSAFNKVLPALALACLASTHGFAGDRVYYPTQPIVVTHGNARALGRLGFRYENGFGVPQNYIAAADLYRRGAERGDAFAQARLGLSYDKGHGVPQDFILAYKMARPRDREGVASRTRLLSAASRRGSPEDVTGAGHRRPAAGACLGCGLGRSILRGRRADGRSLRR
jgi:TPR repeat protein